MNRQPEDGLTLEEKLSRAETFMKRVDRLITEEIEGGQGLRVRTLPQLWARYLEALAAVDAAFLEGRSPDEAVLACEQCAASVYRMALVAALSDEKLRAQLFGDEAGRALHAALLGPKG